MEPRTLGGAGSGEFASEIPPRLSDFPREDAIGRGEKERERERPGVAAWSISESVAVATA
jgi:hypothetical protein